MNYPIVEPNNARSETYRRYLEEILKSEKCPFCPGGATRFDQETLAENEGWWLTRTTQPIAGTKSHFLIIPQKHVLSMQEIGIRDFTRLQEIFAIAQKRFGYENLVCYWREGDPIITGASVSHIHLQCMELAETSLVYFGKYSGTSIEEIEPWTGIPDCRYWRSSWLPECVPTRTGTNNRIRLLPSRDLHSLRDFSDIEWLSLLHQLEKTVLKFSGIVTYWAEGKPNLTGSGTELVVPYCLAPNGTVRLRFGV